MLEMRIPVRSCALWLLLCGAAVFGQHPGGGAAANTEAAGAAFHEGSAAFTAGNLKAAQAAFARVVHMVPTVAAGHAALGSVLLAEGDLRGAARELEEAHRLDPHERQATVNLALVRSQLGEAAAAVALFRSLPGGGEALTPTEALAFATALAQTGQTAEAQTALQGAMSADAGASGAEQASLWNASGTLQAQAGQFADAVESFLRAIALDGTLASAHAHLGSALLRQGVADRALAEFQKAVALGDSSLPTQTELGRALVANGQEAEAVAVLRKAVAAHPDSVEAQYALALALEDAGLFGESLPLFARVTAARGRDVSALTNYGLALVQTGDAKGALVQYALAARALQASEGAATSPAAVTLREDTGVAYLQTNDIDGALEQFHAASAADPGSAQLHYDLGLALKLKDDLPAAVSELERAEALDPKLPDPPYTLGVIRMQQGQAEEAERQFELAVALKPENGEAWALLGSVEKDAGETDKAAEALGHAVTLEPDQPSPHVMLAAILASKGDNAGALAQRKIAAELSRAAVSKQRAGFALQSGRAMLAKGQVAEAIVQLQQAVAAEPGLKEAHLLLAEAYAKAGRPADALTERQAAEKPGP